MILEPLYQKVIQKYFKENLIQKQKSL